MDLNTPITTAARKIARESQVNRRTFFSAEGELLAKLVGTEEWGPQSDVKVTGKITQRRAQDALDALTAEDSFARNNYIADITEARAYKAEQEAK